jgi:hypothetical protein
MRLQAKVGNTTYTIEDQPDGRYVKLSRFNPPSSTKVAEHGEFFVPTGLILEYAVTRAAPRISQMLTKILQGGDP